MVTEYRSDQCLRLVESSLASRSERALVCCAQAKAFEEQGDFEAARLALMEFWPVISERPIVDDLDQRTSAEILLQVGKIAGWIGSARQDLEAKEISLILLGGSIAFYEW